MAGLSVCLGSSSSLVLSMSKGGLLRNESRWSASTSPPFSPRRLFPRPSSPFSWQLCNSSGLDISFADLTLLFFASPSSGFQGSSSSSSLLSPPPFHRAHALCLLLPSQITIKRIERNKRKYVTTVLGLETFGSSPSFFSLLSCLSASSSPLVRSFVPRHRPQESLEDLRSEVRYRIQCDQEPSGTGGYHRPGRRDG